MEPIKSITLEHPYIGKFGIETTSENENISGGDMELRQIEFTLTFKNGEKRSITKLMSDEDYLKMIDELSSETTIKP